MTIYWSIVVLWLFNGEQLPTETGKWLEAHQKFQTAEDCFHHIKQFEEIVVRDFGSPGLVICVEHRRA